MPLTPAELQTRLAPYLPPDPPAALFLQLSAYLELLLRWNARTNLTAIRDPATIVTRHFGESLFAGRLLPAETETLLDLGSGAGFPGLPLQLLRPGLRVTLAESQGKKASFLREVIRTLKLPTEVHAGRAETLPAASFDCVALRAVDEMTAALASARRLAAHHILTFVSAANAPALDASFHSVNRLTLPSTQTQVTLLQP